MSVRPGNISENDEVHFSLWGSLLPWDDEQTLARGLEGKHIANARIGLQKIVRTSESKQECTAENDPGCISGSLLQFICGQFLGVALKALGKTLFIMTGVQLI